MPVRHTEEACSDGVLVPMPPAMQGYQSVSMTRSGGAVFSTVFVDISF